MSQVLTRADVFLSEPHTFSYIPGIARCTLTQATVAGRHYQIQTVKSWLLGNETTVFPAAEALVRQDTTDTEQVVAALVDVLNRQPGEPN
ncbi:hypothetical protein [Amycolatopsis magusensis]|uniref:hypothetical protein n=1 Tax=Amycolatopsis magusensis TaxID=882444 RepID=UPI00378EE032